MKTLAEQLQQDIKDYGDKAFLMWQWQYKDRAYQGDWFDADKPVRLDNPAVNYRRKPNEI